MAAKKSEPMPVNPLEGVSIESILAPKPFKYEYEGVTIEIMPMDDDRLMEVGDSLDKIVQIIGEQVEKSPLGELNAAVILAVVPRLFKEALPAVSQLIAGSLNIDGEVVKRTPMYHKVGLLKGILEAENIEALLKNGKGVYGLFPQAEPQAPDPMDEPIEETEAERNYRLTVEQRMNSLPQDTDGLPTKSDA